MSFSDGLCMATGYESLDDVGKRVAEKAVKEEESSKALQKALSAKLITAELVRD